MRWAFMVEKPVKLTRVFRSKLTTFSGPNWPPYSGANWPPPKVMF
jgi:hypothetical protein